MTQALIRKGFEVSLKTWADALTPALPIAWENVPFVPPVGRYARAFLLPADTESLFFDGTGREYTGVFQVSLAMTIGAGAAAAETLIASLAAYFSVSFTSSGLRITMLRPFSASSPIQEPDRWVIPCSAAYKAVST